MRNVGGHVVKGAAAYQAAGFLSAGLGIATFAAYSGALGERLLGAADLILAWLILLALIGRLGLSEALLRHWYASTPSQQIRLQFSVQTLVGGFSAMLSLTALLLAQPIASWIPATDDPWLVRIAAVGLFIYCNLDVSQTVLRARDDRISYLVASVTNVVLTVVLSLALVIPLNQGLRGYLIGNYAASGLVLAGLWWRDRGVLLHPPKATSPMPHCVPESGDGGELERQGQKEAAAAGNRRALLRFGLPTVPTDLAIFAFNILDRTLLVALATPAAVSALGAFTYSSKIASGVILTARGFQLAFPPLAYRIDDPEHAGRVYAVALRGYALALGATVSGVTLATPWIVEALVHYPVGDPDPRAEVIAVVPLLAVAWSLWGAIPLMTSIAGRLGAPRLTLPAAVVGLLLNILALLLLVPPYGARGAAAALILAYVGLLATLHLSTRRHFAVEFDWPRIALAVAVCGMTIASANALSGPLELGWEGASVRAVAFVGLLAALWCLGLTTVERSALVRIVGSRA